MSSARVALISGCSEEASLGAAFALDLGQKGWTVFATARNIRTLDKLKEAGCQVLSLDVTSDESISNAIRDVAQITHGRLDLLINNAALEGTGPVLDFDLVRVADLYAVNVLGIMRVVQGFAPMLIRSSSKSRPSVIVNFSSTAKYSSPWQGAYGSSKAAADALSESLRFELGPLGIKVVTLELSRTTSAMNNGRRAPYPILRTQASVTPPTPYYSNWNEIKDRITRTMDEGSTVYPSDVAKQVVRAVESQNPPRRVWSGKGAVLFKYFWSFLPWSATDMMWVKVLRTHEIEPPATSNAAESKYTSL